MCFVSKMSGKRSRNCARHSVDVAGIGPTNRVVVWARSLVRHIARKDVRTRQSELAVARQGGLRRVAARPANVQQAVVPYHRHTSLRQQLNDLAEANPGSGSKHTCEARP